MIDLKDRLVDDALNAAIDSLINSADEEFKAAAQCAGIQYQWTYHMTVGGTCTRIYRALLATRNAIREG